MYIHFNNNPDGLHVGDCVVRAISKVMDQSWENTYIDLCRQGMAMKDMPSSNSVFGAYLRSNGFRRFTIPDNFPESYTIEEFCIDNPHGEYLVCTGSHVVAVKDGCAFDAWDSTQELPTYYYSRER